MQQQGRQKKRLDVTGLLEVHVVCRGGGGEEGGTAHLHAHAAVLHACEQVQGEGCVVLIDDKAIPVALPGLGELGGGLALLDS